MKDGSHLTSVPYPGPAASVGYGLDLNGRMRELPDIYELVENTPGGLK
jgi:hypothetical protein